MNIKEWQDSLKKKQKEMEEQVKTALLDAANHALYYVQKTAIPEAKPYPPVGVTGIYAASWKVVETGEANTILLQNDAPYAPVIEYGSRPHIAPLRPLLQWVRRKFGVDDKSAYAIAKGVQNAIAARGTKPRYINLGSKSVFQKFLTQSVREFCHV